MISSSMNLRGEFSAPNDFINFKGSSKKNAIIIETDMFSLSFGDKSIYDKASEKLF